MKWLIPLLVLLHSPSSQADWLTVSDLSIDMVHFFPKGRSPLITGNGLPNRELGQEVGINMELNAGPFYWGNRVQGVADRDRAVGGGQFRSVGWRFEAGLRLIPQVDVYYRHHSEHVLDHAYDPGFPVQDGVGFRLKILGGKK
jgi:hypothetical protein